MCFFKNYICRILFFIVSAIVFGIVAACSGNRENTVKEEPANLNVNFRGHIIPENANTIFIAQIENLTNKPNIPQTLNIALKRQLAVEGRLAVIDNDSSADLLLILKINSYHIQDLERNTRGIPSKQRLRITSHVSLFDRQTKTYVFKDNEVQSFKIFSQVVMPIQSEPQCCEDVLKIMADRIHLMIKTGWYSDLLTDIEKGKK